MMKMELGAKVGYDWYTLLLADRSTDTWSLMLEVGHNADVAL
jgi:hypothetical protein